MKGDTKEEKHAKTTAEEEEEDPRNMWNPLWQKYQVDQGKKLTNYLDCVDRLVMGILKHLIHIFVLVIILSFVAMGYLLITDNGYQDPYEKKFTAGD